MGASMRVLFSLTGGEKARPTARKRWGEGIDKALVKAVERRALWVGENLVSGECPSSKVSTNSRKPQCTVSPFGRTPILTPG
jgi:hypothetical protein